MPVHLLLSIDVGLEERRRSRPSVEEAAHPYPTDEPLGELDPARPVDSGEERVLRPPRPQLGLHRLGVAAVLAREPGGGQQGEVMQPRQLPDLLDIAGFRLGSMVDAEGVLLLRCSQPGDRIEEPIGPDDVGSHHSEDLPASGEQLVGCRHEPGSNLGRQRFAGATAERRAESRDGEHPRRSARGR